jgi:hypothetical protein
MGKKHEVWGTVPGTNGHVEASSHGRVRRVRRGSRWGDVAVSPPHVFTQQEDRYGYRTVCLSLGGRWRPHGVHALVCAAFHGPRPSAAHQAAHGDGTLTRNVPDNLRWATPAEQAADKRRHGRQMEGVTCHLSRLTEAEVLAIRAAYPAATMPALAQQHNVTTANISAIINRKTWKHV